MNVFALSLSLCLPLLLSTAREAKADDRRRLDETYDWFDTLELPDVRRLPYVEISLKTPKERNDRHPDRVSGFLLANDAEGLRLLTHDLCRLRILHSDVEPSNSKLYREIKFVETVEQLLDATRDAQHKPDRPKFGLPAATDGNDEAPTGTASQSDLALQTELLLAAWFCRCLTLTEQIEELERQALILPGRQYWSEQLVGDSLRKEVASGMAIDVLERLVLAMSSRAADWNDISQQLQWLNEHFSEWDDEDRVKTLVSGVRRRLDTQRSQDECMRLDAELEAVLRGERKLETHHAEYLVYCLRDFSTTPDEREARFYKVLRESGTIGVAALIDGLDDITATRYVERPRHRPFHEAVDVSRLCWLTLQIMNRSGGEVYVPPDEPGDERAAWKVRLRKQNGLK